MKKLITLCFFLGHVTLTFAQWNWSEDPEKRKQETEKVAIQQDAIEANNFEGAIPALRWLINNAPDLNPAIYINGVKAYAEMVKKEKDETRKAAYQDTVLNLFDQRIEHFDQEDKVLNLKGYKAYYYYYNRPEEMQNLLDLYEKILDLNKDNTYAYNLQCYMYVVSNLKRAEKMEEMEVLHHYNKMMTVVDKKIESNGDDVKTWEQTRDKIIEVLKSIVTLDCAFVKKHYAPQFKEAPDLKLAHEMKDIMILDKCYTDSLFLEVAEFIANKEPSFDIFKLVAKLYESKKEYSQANEYYQRALENAGNAEDKGEVLKDLAEISARTGQFESARTMYYKALQADPSLSAKVYSAIAGMYLRSGSSCENGNPVTSKAYAIAAYNMYQKAGNTEGMNTAKKYFPKKSDVFQNNMAGQTVNTGCWINETVTIPAIDELPK